MEYCIFFLVDFFYNYLEFKWYCYQEVIFDLKEFLVIGDCQLD